MTKESIFKDLWSKLYIPETANIEVPVYAAMDEYAKQQSIAFGKWLSSGEMVLEPSAWVPGDWYSDKDDRNYTTEQLYDIFISKQQP